MDIVGANPYDINPDDDPYFDFWEAYDELLNDLLYNDRERYDKMVDAYLTSLIDTGYYESIFVPNNSSYDHIDGAPIIKNRESEFFGCMLFEHTGMPLGCSSENRVIFGN